MAYKTKAVVSIATLVALNLAACGFESDSKSLDRNEGSSASGGNTRNTVEVSIGFSDAPVNLAASVVITVDTLTINVPDGNDIVIDHFSSKDLNLDNVDTFQIDLLSVQGTDYKNVIDTLQLPVGNYDNLRIGVLDEDINLSYVEEQGSGLRKPIKVPSDELKLGPFTIEAADHKTLIVEFGLRQALVYNPGPERYILKPNGVRVVDLDIAQNSSGHVDLDALHQLPGCSAKPDPSVGNIAYLYAGHGLDPVTLGDVFVREDPNIDNQEFDPNVPDDIVAPVVASAVDANGDYLFSFINPGDYTLALTCDATDDDPILYDGIFIPTPTTEIIELSITSSQSIQCNFPLVNGECAN